METLVHVLRPAVALAAGAVIGLAFGTYQNRARIRHERLQREGRYASGLAGVPGSMRRVAYLLLALVGAQVLCPVLFDSQAVSWCVSAGIAAGYGWILFSRLRLHRT